MILDSNEETLTSWQDYKQENNEKMEYVKGMIKILANYPDEWYVEDETLYFINEELLEEYNTYYYLASEQEDYIEDVKM